MYIYAVIRFGVFLNIGHNGFTVQTKGEIYAEYRYCYFWNDSSLLRFRTSCLEAKLTLCWNKISAISNTSQLQVSNMVQFMINLRLYCKYIPFYVHRYYCLSIEINCWTLNLFLSVHVLLCPWKKIFLYANHKYEI